MKTPSLLVFTFVSAIYLSPLASAQEEEAVSIPEIRVWGSLQERLSEPTAPQRISQEALKSFKYNDVNRALKQAPGVYVREEEGQGLRPNIGLRGTNPDRSKKIVIMEDGVLIGPAPYSAPAAYYTPSMNHTESFDIYKGFSAMTYGPNSIGGAVNYVTRSITAEPTTTLDVRGGSYGTYNFLGYHSNSTSWGGYLINASRRQSDGFKKIDGGGFTGFYQDDYMGKLRFNLPSENGIHNIELKLGYAKEDSNETYLGLTEQDFYDNPRRRYRASQADEMQWEHFTGKLDHNLQIGESGLLTTSLYRNDFHRTWYRLDRFQDGTSIRNVLLNPTEGQNSIYLNILRGDEDSSVLGANGQLLTLSNRRVFFSQGLQGEYTDSFETGPVRHRLTAGYRLHQDRIRRDHTYDLYEMLNANLNRTSTGTVQDNNEEEALAKVLYAKNDIEFGPSVVTLAARYENVDFDYTDNQNSTTYSRTESAFIPGIGYLHRITDTLSARASVNQAVTLAGLSSKGEDKREESWNYEVGLTYFKDAYTPQLDVIFFYNDYQNLTGTCTTSTGCSANQLDEQFDGGKALIQGVEARFAQGFQWGKVWIPVQLNATYIHAAFNNSFNSENAEWGGSQAAPLLIEKGDPLPYVPQYQYNLIVSTEYKKWSQEIAVIYQGKMYDQSARVDRREVGAYGIVDWRGSYKFAETGSVYITADNVFNRNYMTSLKPFGYRGGKPQSLGLGVSYTF